MGIPAKPGRHGGILLGALAVDAVGNGLFLPLSLVFFSRLTDVPLGLLGILISIANAVTLPVPVWAGALADRFGALPLVVLAQLMQATGYLAYNWATRPVGIFLSVGLVAVGVRFFWSSIFTAVADHVDGSSTTVSKDRWFSRITVVRTAGLGFGGLITGAVVAGGGHAAYHAVTYGAAGCFAAAAVAIIAFVRAPRPAGSEGDARAGYGTMLRDGPFLTLVGVNTVFAMTIMMFSFALPTVVLSDLRAPGWLVSAALVGNTVLVSVLAAPLIGRLAPCRRTRVLMAAAGLWAAWAFLLCGAVPGRPARVLAEVAAATVLFTLAEVIHAPVSMALATDIAPIEARGRYLAVFQYSFTFAGIIVPAFFTTLFDIRHALPWAVLGTLDCLGIVALGLLDKHLPRSAQRDAVARQRATRGVRTADTPSTSH